MADLREQLKAFVEPIKRRILLMFSRAVIRKTDDSGGIQLCQIEALEDEIRDGVERFQEYGFTSHPPKNSEAIAAFIGGNRSHGIILKVENREARPADLEEGEVAFYTDEGDEIYFKRNRELHIRSNKFKFEGETEELMDLLIQVATEMKDLADKLSTDTTNTLIGPQPLNGFSYYGDRKTALISLIAKLTAMKV